MAHTVCLIRGDGIGPEVTEATQRVIEAAGVAIDWIDLPAGKGAVEAYGKVLPGHTLEQIAAHKIALKGPVTTPIGKGFKSVNVQLRMRLNLYCAIRPVRSLAGVKTRYEDVDIVVFRENTEGLYSGLENEIAEGVVTSLKVVTRKASERIARSAFRYCQERGRKKVTVFHKANIMKKSDGLFLDCVRRVHEEMAPEIEYEELIIDNACMQLVRNPERFDVLLLENLFGDIISDLCAGLVGGLGVVPGANYGDDSAVFEAVHGSAPDIAGQDLANPLALIMSGVMMLRHLGEVEKARAIRDAYDALLAEGDPSEKTRDLGGTAGTRAFTDALIRRLA
ncbi:MAG: isocitrate/isopropylmalate dehydrogenase family protein [Candidatus Hydrogenedentes bacterium]|nr:isocitrate/isopropylmalate dehydrogenase family protein [Candidatus Hydrogenedentota bacterium]